METAPAFDAAALLRFVERHALSGHDVARLADLHPTTAQDLIAGRAAPGPATASKIVRMMAEYVAVDEEVLRDGRGRAVTPTPVTAAAEPERQFLATRAARTVMGTLDKAARKRWSGGIFGDPGVGKSVAVAQWSATTKYRHLLVTCRAYSSYSQIVRTLARGLGIGSAGLLSALDDAVHDELAAHPRLLLFDEADMLTARILDWLRSLVDASGAKTNFVLLGKPAFYRRLETSHARSSQDLRQVWSRLAFRKFLGGIEREEMLAAIAAHGLDGALEPEAADPLYAAIAGSYRDLEMTIGLIEQIVEENPKLGGKITRAVVAKAVESRFGAGIGRRR